MKWKIFTLLLLICNAASFAGDIAKDEINAFAAKTGAVPTIDKATNSLSFLRFPVGRSLQLTGATPEEKTRFFLKKNAGLFGLHPDRDTYVTKASKKDGYGLEHVEVQQYFQGVPVFEGILKFHFGKSAGLSSLNGNFIPVTKLNTIPAVSMKEAADEAIRLVTGQRHANFKIPLKVIKSTLYVFQKGLAQGYQGVKYLVYEIEVRNDADIREFLYIDAHSKALIEQFTGMHQIHRTLYEEDTEPGNKTWEEGDPLPGTLDEWQESEVKSAGHIYNLMKNAFGHTSYNNGDAPMITINNSPNIDCPDANWNGVVTNFCTGIASDDIVAHEWAHAYTEYTSGLVYAWQPGAINESYSDIWGETVDQLNRFMDEDESSELRTDCGSSARWEVGEKSFEFEASGRDMWNPNCKSAPGKITDPLYWCASTRDGGVHVNSGVLNHAYALLVDGGQYNGQTIRGLGLTKAAHIFWHAQANYMTKTTDFAAQADILEASLADLMGVGLNRLSTDLIPGGLSGEVITADDARELSKVIAAVELRTNNNCNFQTILQPLAAICIGGSRTNSFFYEDFEAGMANWKVGNAGSKGTWTPRNWVLDATAPGGRTGNVVYGVDYTGGDCGVDFQNGVISLESPVIMIPPGASGPFSMAFDHFIAIEAPYDGGNIKFRINNGEWALLPASAFIANGYNRTINNTNQEGANPLQGQPTFSGIDEGAVVSSWGQSRVDLSSLGLEAGQNIQFRWDLGTDGCVGLDGWYIDDVRVYSCSLPTVQFVTNSTSINEGEADTTEAGSNECLRYVQKTVTVKINKAPSAPVTVTFNPPTGTATEGVTADYSFAPASFVLQEGALSQDVEIRIYNDAYVEGNETVVLSYNLSTTGDAKPESYNQEHKLTITDNDFLPGSTKTEMMFEDFNLGLLPADWFIIGEESFPDSWGVVQNPDVSLDPGGSPLLMIDSYAAGRVAMDKVVESGTFNTVGMSSIKLSFIEFFYVYPSGFREKGMVDVWDGSHWHNLLTQSQSTGTSGSWDEPAVRNITIPVTYANPAMKIRFRYIANNDYWWAVDNIKITAENSTQVESKITAVPDAQYLGPHGTAYFYDPDTKNLMAQIHNLTDHDYGCTTVAIDRIGQDTTKWIGSYHITNKTFKVTPTYNNPSGNYEITLYYKASELPKFNGTLIRSMGKSLGGITTSNNPASSVAESVVSNQFGSDYSFTSIFHSGFSGFGLSDAPPNGPLPVTLVSFEGKHSTEGNLLTWTTTSEVNNDYFVIERSKNGRDFKLAGRVEGVGNSAAENHYKFTDTGFPEGISYYRLKQVDSDGTFTYSRIIFIDALSGYELKFFPNPVQSVLTIELPDNETKAVNIRVINSAGQEVFAKQNVKSKNGSLKLDMHDFPSGIYKVILSEKQEIGEKKDFHLSVFKL